MLTKAAIRREVRERRAACLPETAQRAGAAAQARVLALDAFAQARGICCYLALPGEVATDAIVAAAWAAGKVVCVPARDAATGRYRPALLRRDTPTAGGVFGVTEPVAPQWVEPDQVDVAVVPGLAFDPAGGRVGHGAGHYDRLLAAAVAAGARWVRVGLAFEFQVWERVPVGDHDVRMDWVITEARALPTGAGAAATKGGTVCQS